MPVTCKRLSKTALLAAVGLLVVSGIAVAKHEHSTTEVAGLGRSEATAKCPPGESVHFGGFKATVSLHSIVAVNRLAAPVPETGGPSVEPLRDWTAGATGLTPENGQLTSIASCAPEQLLGAVTETTTVGPRSTGTAIATCPQGSSVHFGGFAGDLDPNQGPRIIITIAELVSPVEWRVSAINQRSQEAGKLEAIAYCGPEHTLHTVVEPTVLPQAVPTTASAECRPGQHLVFGGFRIEAPGQDFNGPYLSGLEPGAHHSWQASAFNFGTSDILSSIAYCRDLPGPPPAKSTVHHTVVVTRSGNDKLASVDCPGNSEVLLGGVHSSVSQILATLINRFELASPHEWTAGAANASFAYQGTLRATADCGAAPPSEKVSHAVMVAPGQSGTATAECPAGKSVWLGGFAAEHPKPTNFGPAFPLLVTSAERTSPPTWRVTATAREDGQPPLKLTSVAYCASGQLALRAVKQSANVTGPGTAAATCPAGEEVVMGGFSTTAGTGAPPFLDTLARRGRQWHAGVVVFGTTELTSIAYCGQRP